MTKNIYEEHGYANRMEYLKSLADENDVTLSEVLAIADLLGENEDFDGLVSEVEDYANMQDDGYEEEEQDWDDDDYDDEDEDYDDEEY